MISGVRAGCVGLITVLVLLVTPSLGLDIAQTELATEPGLGLDVQVRENLAVRVWLGPGASMSTDLTAQRSELQ